MFDNNLYSIYDRVAEDYGPLFEAKNHGVATRHYFSAMANNPAVGDFQLIHLGRIERSSGTPIITNQPEGKRVVPLGTKDSEI